MPTPMRLARRARLVAPCLALLLAGCATGPLAFLGLGGPPKPKPVVVGKLKQAPSTAKSAVPSPAAKPTAKPAAPPPVDAAAMRRWKKHQAVLAGIESFDIYARIVVTAPKDSWSAAMRWQQHGTRYGVRLSTPFGQGIVDLQGKPGLVVLRTAQGKTYAAPDPGRLLQQVTGWRLPMAGLRWWVMGAADPAMPVTAADPDDDGILQTLQQTGWHLEYDRYRRFDGVPMPVDFRFRNAEVRGHMLVTEWRIARR